MNNWDFVIMLKKAISNEEIIIHTLRLDQTQKRSFVLSLEPSSNSSALKMNQIIIRKT